MLQQLDSLTRFLIPLLAFVLTACGSNETASDTGATALPDGEVVVEKIASENATFRIVQVVDSLDTPWGVGTRERNSRACRRSGPRVRAVFSTCE